MKILNMIKRYISRRLEKRYRAKFPHVHPTARISRKMICLDPNNLVMEEYTNINPPARLSTQGSKFIMKKRSGAAAGLYVLPGNHMFVVGKKGRDIDDKYKQEHDVHHEYDRDIVVDEDVWIGSRVCLLNGVHIGRGAVIGTGSVVRKSIPPYAIVIGNPAKIVGFIFTPDEVIEHEKKLFSEEERLPYENLVKNYDKYLKKRLKEIKDFTKL